MNGNNDTKQDDLEIKDEKKPDEKAGLYFSTHFKIYDPNTNEIYVKERGDN